MIHSPPHSPMIQRQLSTKSADHHISSGPNWAVGKYAGKTAVFDEETRTYSFTDSYLPREAFAYMVLQQSDRTAWSWRRIKIAEVISHVYFDAIMGLVIVVNAVIIGVEIDYESRGSRKWFQILDMLFLSVFILEAACKLYVFRLMYFSRCVNIGDIAIVIFGVIAVVLHIQGSDAEIKDDMRKFTVLKLARLLRLVRIVRLSTQFHSLWIIVQGLYGCINTVLWTTVLLMTVTYFFAVLAIEYITSDQEVQSIEFSGGESFGERFENIPSALVSLLSFFAIDNVSSVGWALMRIRPWTCLYLLAWTLMVPIVLLNLITAVIVEISINAAKKDESHRQAVENEEWQRVCKEFEHLFIKMTHELEPKGSRKLSRTSEMSGNKTNRTSEESFQGSGSNESLWTKTKRVAKSLIIAGDGDEEEMIDFTKMLTKQRVFQLSDHEEIREKLNMLFGEAPNSTRGFDRLMELWVVLDTDNDNQLSITEFTEGMGRLHNVINSHNSDTFVMLRMVQELKKAHEERAQQSNLLKQLQKSQEALCQQVIALTAEVHALSSGKRSRGITREDSWYDLVDQDRSGGGEIKMSL